MIEHWTDHQFLLDHRLIRSQLPQRQISNSSVRKGNAGRNILVPCTTCGEDWSDDLRVADYEDLRGSEVAKIYVNRFRSQDIFVKGPYECLCAKKNSTTSQSPKTIVDCRVPSRKIMLKSSEAIKKERPEKDSWSVSTVSRHFSNIATQMMEHS